ncbi:MAG: hypothetical protein KDA55_02515 [Planctomycetales bacterium]|nr:hypothetical protein [Planctomycetales bacterium]
MPSSAYALPEPVVTPRQGILNFGMGMNVRQFFPIADTPDAASLAVSA